MNKQLVFLCSEKLGHLFSLAGFKQMVAGDPLNAQKIIDELTKDETIGVIFFEETLFDQLDEKYKHFLERRWNGVVAKIPSPTLISEESYLLKLINRALGYQIKIV